MLGSDEKWIIMALAIFALAAGARGADEAAKAAAEEPAGTVAALRGKAEAVDATGATRLLAIKSPIFRADTLKTGDDGRLQLLFADNTVVNLGPKSELKIEKYAYKPESRTGAISVNVKNGAFQVKAGEIGRLAPENFKTITPSGTIGIRGSIFAGSWQSGMLLVVFLGGQGITVNNEFGHLDITTSGFGTQVREGQAPPPAAPMPAEQIMALRNLFLAGGQGQGSGDGGWELGGETFDSGVNIPGADIVDSGFAAPLLDNSLDPLATTSSLVDQAMTSGLAGDLLQATQQNYGFGEYEIIAWGLVNSPDNDYPEYLVNGTLLGRHMDKFTSLNDISGVITIYEEADDELMQAYLVVGGAYGYDVRSARDFTAGLGGYYYSGDTEQWYPVITQPAAVSTGPLSQQWCEYATWGYWCSLQRWYEDPEVIFKAEGFWVGGQPTSSSDIISLFAANGGNGTVARYQGGAYVDIYDTTGKSSAYGSSDLTFVFNAAEPSFGGNLSFPSRNLTFDVSGDSVWPNGFRGKITYINNEETSTENLNGIFGKFYGPNAQNAAGGFGLEHNGTYYNGVFGGNCVSREPAGQKAAE